MDFKEDTMTKEGGEENIGYVNPIFSGSNDDETIHENNANDVCTTTEEKHVHFESQEDGESQNSKARRSQSFSTWISMKQDQLNEDTTTNGERGNDHQMQHILSKGGFRKASSLSPKSILKFTNKRPSVDTFPSTFHDTPPELDVDDLKNETDVTDQADFVSNDNVHLSSCLSSSTKSVPNEYGRKNSHVTIQVSDTSHDAEYNENQLRNRRMSSADSHRSWDRGTKKKRKYSDRSANEMFIELLELHRTESEELEWKERARWLKYEEDYEEETGRWGKPHVASLNFTSLNQLQDMLRNGLLLLDVECENFFSLSITICEHLVQNRLLHEKDAPKLKQTILSHRQHISGRASTRRNSIWSLASRRRSSAVGNHLKRMFSRRKDSFNDMDKTSTRTEDSFFRPNTEILDKLSEDAEAFPVMVGEVEFLDKPICIFIRTDESREWDGMVEVPIPTKFLFLCLGPAKKGLDYFEIGRSMSTIMATEDFHQIAIEALSERSILRGISEFLENSLVLPPGDWEVETLLPIINLAKEKHSAIEVRRKSLHPLGKDILSRLQERSFGDPLEKTGHPFGGMINDIKRRFPKYLSDITDGFHLQCVATFFYMYFSCLASIIAYGGLLSDKTSHWLGMEEVLLATAMCGVFFSLFSANPLKIVAVSGPILLYEEALYKMFTAMDIEYISARAWVLYWIAMIAIILAALDGSILVRYVTRFTEETFSALISLIFIYETFAKLSKVFQKHPMGELISIENNAGSSGYGSQNYSAYTSEEGYFTYGNVSYNLNKTEYDEDYGYKKEKLYGQPNTALLSLIFTLGTFAIAFYLRTIFRNSHFLGRHARRFLGDFGVPIALTTMVLVDYAIHDVYTEKLDVPDGLKPTKSDERGWFVNPLGVQKALPTWAIFFSIIPAILGFILIFVETQITEVILNNPERKLKKGSGFHLDILLISLMMVVNGLLGLPLMTVTAVKSIAHINSLSVKSKTHAPGEKPHLVHVYEQRLTNMSVHVMIGVSVLMGPILKYIPLSVVYGIFLYSGVASIHGVELFNRFFLLFVPNKHHPDKPFVTKVRTWKMHFFTIIQVLCLAILWAVKYTDASLAFPFVVFLMVPLRRFILPYLFSGKELFYLDQDMSSDIIEEDRKNAKRKKITCCTKQQDEKEESPINVKDVIDLERNIYKWRTMSSSRQKSQFYPKSYDADDENEMDSVSEDDQKDAITEKQVHEHPNIVLNQTEGAVGTHMQENEVSNFGFTFNNYQLECDDNNNTDEFTHQGLNGGKETSTKGPGSDDAMK